MLVHLSETSWHSRFYKLVKGVYPTYEFKSLCPYFWTIVFYILCSPLILVWKILKLVLNFLVVKPICRMIDRSILKSINKPYKEPTKFEKWWDKHGGTIGKWVGRIWISIIIALALLVLGFAVYDLFHKKGVWLGLIYLFAVIGITTTLILIIFGILEFKDSDTWRMIKGMGYSVKNKVCPMIKWDEKLKNEI